MSTYLVLRFNASCSKIVTNASLCVLDRANEQVLPALVIYTPFTPSAKYKRALHIPHPIFPSLSPLYSLPLTPFFSRSRLHLLSLPFRFFLSLPAPRNVAGVVRSSSLISHGVQRYGQGRSDLLHRHRAHFMRRSRLPMPPRSIREIDDLVFPPSG